MPDVCDLVLDDHELFRRRFAELDDLRSAGADSARLGEAWTPLADRLDLHADAEEQLFYPELLRVGRRGEDETQDAIKDHNDIRDAVRRAGELGTGSDDWWEAVRAAGEANSDHMAEEERDAIADFRSSAPPQVREELGSRWVEFERQRASGSGIDRADKSPRDYIREHG